MNAQRGFTLIEMVVAMALLGTMMLLIYAGLSFGMRSWDAAETHGGRIADRRIAENFLRREIAETFPMRWKDPLVLRVAFEGTPGAMRFVSTRAAGITVSGLSLVGLEVEQDSERRTRNLVMSRARADSEAQDFAPLQQGERTVLIEGVDAVGFAYYGAENDFTDPGWVDAWEYQGRIPQLVRLSIRLDDGTLLPDMVVKVRLGEEAGCLENSFQRVCRPRRE
jgi:general secretion pathway protein J